MCLRIILLYYELPDPFDTSLFLPVLLLCLCLEHVYSHLLCLPVGCSSFATLLSSEAWPRQASVSPSVVGARDPNLQALVMERMPVSHTLGAG